MSSVRVAIVGVGNCAASLVQGVETTATPIPRSACPLMHVQFGDFHVRDLTFVAAFDVDAKKVGQDLSEAILASENNTIKIADVPPTGVVVQRGHTYDGLGKYFRETITESDESRSTSSPCCANPGRCARLLPAGRLRASREVLRAVRDRRRGRVRQRIAGLHRRDAGVGAQVRGSWSPDHRRRHQVAGRRDDPTGCSRSCSRTAASSSTARCSSTSAATWTS